MASLTDDIRAIAEANGKIEAIKFCRQMTGLRLKGAKERVEAIMAGKDVTSDVPIADRVILQNLIERFRGHFTETEIAVLNRMLNR